MSRRGEDITERTRNEARIAHRAFHDPLTDLPNRAAFGDYIARTLDRAIAILRRIKNLGVRIAMDDFGTGYSSLSYLQAFPFDKIKIDQTFVAKIGKNTSAAAIIHAILGLGRALALPVIAG